MFSLFLTIISRLVFKYILRKPITLHINLLKVFLENIGACPQAIARGRAIRSNLPDGRQVFFVQRQQKRISATIPHALTK
jgi:hypothetical protein